MRNPLHRSWKKASDGRKRRRQFWIVRRMRRQQKANSR